MRFLAIAGLAALPSLAAAGTSHRTLRSPGHASPGDLVSSSSGSTVLLRQVIPDTGASAFAQSRIIYLNHTGITVTVGQNDSRTNKSTLVDRTRSIKAWTVSDDKWKQTVACMTDMFARFAVVVTDRDPGNVPHIEAVFGGAPADLGMPSNAGGVSPFTQTCGIVENSIVFAFTDVLPSNPQKVCEVMAQEVAHSYGLDHELLAADPMTYLSYTGNRSFQDQAAPCGENQARACGLTSTPCRATQNSVALLRDRVGTADAVPPMIAVTGPAQDANVAPGFAVTATGTDNLAVRSATLQIDGDLAASVEGAGPFAFVTPGDLPAGPHELVVEISDGVNATSQTLHVTMIRSDDDSDGGGGMGLGCRTGSDVGLAFGLTALAAQRLNRRRRQNQPLRIRT